MLEGIRRYQYSWQVQVPFAILALVMAFWGFGMGMFNRVHPIATINGNRILADQVEHAATQIREAMQQRFGANASAVLQNVNLRQEALDRLIDSQLISDEARNLGISVSDEALQEKIATLPAFQRDGQFDFDTYQEVLRENNLLPSEFENDERKQMVEDLLHSMVSAGVQVSDDEARHAYNLRNERIGMRYIEIPYNDFVAKVTPAADKIDDYYKKNAEQFRTPERVKITYIHYAPLSLAARYTPTDKEIQDYYSRNAKTEFTHEEQVHARHILFVVPAGATDSEKAAAKAKALEVLKQAQAGGDFAKLAEKYSEDPSTRLSGGDLGTFGRGQMIKPFEDAAFAMKPGQVTMAETRYGFHVIKVEEINPARTDTLAEVKPKVIDALRTQAGAKLARDATREDLAAALSGTSLQDLAKKRGLDAVETPMFAQNEPIKGAESDRELNQYAFKLEPGDTRVVPANGAPYLVRLMAKEPSGIPPLKTIEAQVLAAMIRSSAEADAANQAEKILVTIKSAADFDKVAAANKLLVSNVSPVPRADHTIPGLGEFPEVTDAAAAVPTVPGVIDRVMEHDGNSYVFEVVSRSEPGDDDWKSAQKSFIEEYLEQRRTQAWTQFVDQLKNTARIQIDTDQLGAAESSM